MLQNDPDPEDEAIQLEADLGKLTDFTKAKRRSHTTHDVSEGLRAEALKLEYSLYGRLTKALAQGREVKLPCNGEPPEELSFLKRGKEDQEEALEQFDLANPELAETVARIKDRVAKISAKRVEKLREALRRGIEYDLRDAVHLLHFGTDQDRAELRSLFLTPEALARNQDLVLPHIRAALNGVENSRAYVEERRLVAEEAVPVWFADMWRAESSASWRTLDLHSTAVRKFVRRIGSKIRPEYKQTSLLPLSAGQHGDNDPRAAMLNYFSGTQRLKEAAEEVKSRFEMSSMFVLSIMKQEVEEGLLELHSPSIIGKFYRGVIRREYCYLFTAALIDDVCLALNLPLDDAAKRQVWKQCKDSPWSIAGHDLVRKGAQLLERLQATGLEGQELSQQFSHAVTSRGEQRRLFRQEYEDTAESRTLTHSTPPRSKRLMLQAALELYSDSSFDREREARVLARLVRDDASRFEHVMNCVYKGFDVAWLIETLEADRTPTLREILYTALELHGTSVSDQQRDARVIAKFVETDLEKFKHAMKWIRSDRDVQQLVTTLRAARPLTADKERGHKATGAEEEVVDERERARIRKLLIEAEGKLELTTREPVYSPEAQKRMRDGRIRHLVTTAVELYMEHPERADAKKIRQVDSVWELRILGPGLRVYFMRPGNHEMIVLLAGPKEDQTRDVLLLPAIRDREKEKCGA